MSERDSRVAIGPPDAEQRANGAVPAARGPNQPVPEDTPGTEPEQHILPKTPSPEAPAIGTELALASRQLAAMQEREQSASELRAALEDLRRVLDVSPLPPRRRRRWPLRALMTLVVLAVIAGLALAGRPLLDNLGQEQSAPGVTSAPSAPAQTPAVELAAPGTGSPTAASLPSTGPGIDSPGTYAAVAISDDGSGVDAFEQVLLPAPGLQAFRLTVPTLQGLTGDVARLRPQVLDLQVALDGQVAQVQRSGAGWTATPLQGGSVTKAQLRYRLSGVIVRSTPSLTGRALALVGPLTADTVRAQGLPVAMRFADPAVRGAVCPTAEPKFMLCGREGERGWTVSIPAEAATPVVLAQLSLQPPG